MGASRSGGHHITNIIRIDDHSFRRYGVRHAILGQSTAKLHEGLTVVYSALGTDACSEKSSLTRKTRGDGDVE